MSIEEEDDRPRRDITELMPIGLALILTAAAIALCFFKFSAGGPSTPVANQPMHLERGEVMIGVGAGSNIHPPQPNAPPHNSPSGSHP